MKTSLICLFFLVNILAIYAQDNQHPFNLSFGFLSSKSVEIYERILKEQSPSTGRNQYQMAIDEENCSKDSLKITDFKQVSRVLFILVNSNTLRIL